MKVKQSITAFTLRELEIKGAILLSADEVESLLTSKERRYPNWWWLRSPGINLDDVACAHPDGSVFHLGYCVRDYTTCVRPALIIDNIEKSKLKIGDVFKINDYEFKIISRNLAWLYKQDIGNCYFDSTSNNYEVSEIKRFVNNWFNELTK